MRVAPALLLALLALGCGERDGASASAPASASKPAAAAPAPLAADGTRPIDIAVSPKGYLPAAITARAGDRLVLRFTRTEDFECGRHVKVPGVPGQTELPVGQAVAIPVTMPADGDLVFTCGMDMFRGVVTLVR